MATKQVRKPGRPAKKTRRSFAAGGVVHLAQGEKVPDAEEIMRKIGANQYGGAGPSPAPVQRTLADAVGGAATSAVQGGRDAMNAAADYGRSVVDAAAPALNRAAEKAKGFAQEAWNVSPIRDAAAAADDWATQYNRNAFGPSAAPVARAAHAPAEARRPGGTIGRLGRTPGVPTDADFFSPAAVPPAPTQPGAVLPAASNNAYGTQDEILGAAAQSLKAQRAADAVSPERVAGARRQAQFDERNTARDRGQGMVGGSLAGQQATADNVLLQKWYSMPENQRGRMPASVENAKYRGADDTETAFNVARARIMEARLHPTQQAQALANLDKTRADMLDQAQQTRQMGEYQQGQVSNDRERAGAYRQQVEQTGQQQQAQLAHQQRVAQLALDQGYAQGLFLPDESFNDEAAKLENGAEYSAKFEQRRAARAAAKARWVQRIMAGETPEQILQNPGADADVFSTLLNPSAGMMTRKYAGGGMVSPQAPVYGGMPDAQRADPLINAYRVYTTQSKAMGAPTVPFAEFSSLYAGAVQGPTQPPVGMAKGGAVPAAGKMVIDTDPNAPTDSIPAVIDGKHPAKLDSGEFVFPHDVSMYYGTKFLNGLIEKAKAALGQGAPGGKPATSQTPETDDEGMEVEFAAGGLVQENIDAGYGLTAGNTFGYANPTEQFASALDTARHDARWSQGHSLTGSQQDRAIDDRAALGAMWEKAGASEPGGAVQAAAPAQTRPAAPAAPTPQAPPRRRMSTFAPDLNNLNEPLTTPSYADGGPVLPVRSTYDQLRMRGQDVNAAVNQMTAPPPAAQGFSGPQYPAQARTRPAPRQSEGVLGGGMPGMERAYAQGGPVSGWNVDRSAQIEGAVNSAMGQPQPQAVPAPPPAQSDGMQLSEGEQYMLQQNRAREAAAMAAQKPAWRRALGFAGGGAVQSLRGY